MIKKEYLAICILLTLVLAVLVILNFVSPLLIWDENIYLGNARGHISHSNFTEDFRFPLTEYIISLVWLITGESIFIARLIIIIFTLLSVLFVYLAGKRFFSKKVSLLLASLFASSPLILFWGFRVYADIPAMFFTILGFYFLLKNEELGPNKKYIFIALAGVSLALAFLSRFPLALFAVCVFPYLIIKKKIKEPLIFVIFFLITISPWLIYNQIAYKNPIWDLMQQFSVVQQWTTLEPISKQLINLFYTLGIFVIPLILGFISFAKKGNKKPLKWVLLSYVLVSLIYYLFFVKLKDMRYYIAFLPFLYVLVVEGIIFLKNKIKNKKLITAIFIILLLNSLLLLCGTFYMVKNEGDCNRNGAMLESISYLKSSINENELIVSNCWPWFGYYLNVKTFSPWASPESLIKNYNASRIIICSWLGEPYSKDELKAVTLEKEFSGKCNQKLTIYKKL